MFEKMRQPGHRFAYTDLLTGNVSLGQQLFQKIGGFNETLRCHEDYELGIRLLDAGAELTFSPRACGTHYDQTDLPRSLERKRQEGRADVQLARLHPSIRPTLLAAKLTASFRPPGIAPWALGFALAARSVCALALGAPRLGDPLIPVGVATLGFLEKWGIRQCWRLGLDALMAYCYWRGVAVECQDPAELATFTRALPAEPGVGGLTPLDLSSGLNSAAEWVDQTRPAGLRLYFHHRHLGDLSPQAGAERLRGVHLRQAVATVLAKPYLNALRASLVESETRLPLPEAAGSDCPMLSTHQP
jgi:hypothetical protein